MSVYTKKSQNVLHRKAFKAKQEISPEIILDLFHLVKKSYCLTNKNCSMYVFDFSFYLLSFNVHISKLLKLFLFHTKIKS